MSNEDLIQQLRADYPPSGVEFAPSYPGYAVTDANLVLEGGSMRGLFTAGVTDYFMDQGLFCKTVIGVSAGALAAYNYVAGLIGRSAYLNIKFCPDHRYLSLSSYAFTKNAFNRELSFDLIPNEIDPMPYDALNNSPMNLITVASNLETGEADYHLFADAQADLPYLIASSSVPLVSQIVEVDGKQLLDGGICDSIPIFYSLTTGAQKHIVVCTRPESYVRSPNKLMPLIRQHYHKYPYFIDRAEERHYDYNRLTRALTRMHETGQCFVIRPEKPVELASMEHDQRKLLDLYEQGVAVAARKFDALKRYLEAPAPSGFPESF